MQLGDSDLQVERLEEDKTNDRTNAVWLVGEEERVPRAAVRRTVAADYLQVTRLSFLVCAACGAHVGGPWGAGKPAAGPAGGGAANLEPHPVLAGLPPFRFHACLQRTPHTTADPLPTQIVDPDRVSNPHGEHALEAYRLLEPVADALGALGSGGGSAAEEQA